MYCAGPVHRFNVRIWPQATHYRYFDKWADAVPLSLPQMQPAHVAAYIEGLSRPKPDGAGYATATVKQHLSALKMLGDFLVIRHPAPRLANARPLATPAAWLHPDWGTTRRRPPSPRSRPIHRQSTARRVRVKDGRTAPQAKTRPSRTRPSCLVTTPSRVALVHQTRAWPRPEKPPLGAVPPHSSSDVRSPRFRLQLSSTGYVHLRHEWTRTPPERRQASNAGYESMAG